MADRRRIRLGVDLGGTKIECIAMDDDGAILERRRTPTPQGDYDAVIATIVRLAAEVEAACGAGPSVIGIGTPGSISPFSGLMRNSNSTILNGRPFGEDLAKALGGRPMRIENDANCFAVSEAADGAAAGAHVVFGVIIGTGVGGGVVVGGKPLSGANGIAGEWGHTKLPAMDDEEASIPRCWCGRQGCLETFLSGPALAADYVRLGGEAPDGRTVVERRNAGEALATTALKRYEDRMGRALSGVVNLLDPDVIVLGGGLSNVDGLADAVMETMRPHVFSDDMVTRIVVNRHGDSSGVRGAAWLWSVEEL